MNINKLKEQLYNEEGFREKPYIDSVGKMTIGVGHNLTDNGLSLKMIELLLEEDIQNVIKDLDMHLPWWKSLDEVRARIIADLCFNLGLHKLTTFVRFNLAMQTGDYGKAAYELKNSQWYNQVGTRGPKLVKMILTGLDPK